MEKREILKETELFVLDMDGTFYLDTDVLDGALDFLEEVKKAGKRYVFFTNNSSKSPKTYIDKLAKMGCYIKRNQIITSGDVMIQYLKEYYPEKKVYLVGTPDLEENFRENGILLTREMPDVVVIGFDMTLTYEKLERACTYIRNGAVFLATHLDINCPTKDGFIPDCGAMCAAISLSTGKEPKYVGKPFKETVDMVLEMTGAKREAMSFVGDRIYTDVKTGVVNGAHGILVLTGETKLEDVPKADVVPDAILIAAIKSWEGLEKSLKSECKVVFVLFGTICDIDQIVARIKDAGKVAIVHVDMIQGLSTKRVAVDFIAHNTRADGIISTKNTLVERAKEMGLYAIQRTFVVDSIALDTLKKQIEMFRPDAVEIMPGVMPKILKIMREYTDIPLIAGGLLSDKKDVMAAFEAGTDAISATNEAVWYV